MKRNLVKALGLLAVSAVVITTACNKEKLSPSSDGVNTEDETSQALAKPSHHYGCQLLQQNELDKLPKFQAPLSAAKALPAKVMLAHPPVGDQGSQGSCVGWGTSTSRAVDLYVVKNYTTWSNSTDILSAAYIYNQVKVNSDCGSGAYIKDALNLLKNQGVSTYSSMPYVEGNCAKQPTSAQKQNASDKKIASWSSIKKSDLNSIKSKLAANHPVVIGISVDQLWEDGGDKNHVWKKNNGSTFGGHCVSIVGYDDAMNAFYVQNSWGTGWGAQGMIWIDYGMFSNYKVNEVYSIQ